MQKKFKVKGNVAIGDALPEDSVALKTDMDRQIPVLLVVSTFDAHRVKHIDDGPSIHLLILESKWPAFSRYAFLNQSMDPHIKCLTFTELENLLLLLIIYKVIQYENKIYFSVLLCCF